MYQLLLLILVLVRVVEVSASIEVSSIFPNTPDDTNLEWIEFRNTGCEDIDISGFSISDISSKKYVFATGTAVSSHSVFRLERGVSKIILNNDNETLSLYDSQLHLIDEFTYSNSQKGIVINDTTVIDDECSILPPPTDSGSNLENNATGSEMDYTNTGEVIDTGSTIYGTGNFYSGSQNSSGVIIDSIGSGATSSGSDLDGDFLEVGTGSGSIDTFSGITNSGVVDESISTSYSGGQYVETGMLTPIEMHYSDSDGNAKIDTLEVIYPYTLTGSVNTGSIALFSRSGGLYSVKIDTEFGYILSGSLSGNVLVLKIKEGDLEKRLLKINNTTDSDLRLKSSGNLGFTSVGNQNPEHFFLTTTFNNYRNVSQSDPNIRIGNDSMSGSNIFSGGTNSIETGNILDGISFPQIIPIIQSPTNALLSGGVFLCDTNINPCRINLTFDSIFTGSYLSKDYSCRITAGTGVYETCNPNTIYFNSSGSIDIMLRHKSSGQEMITKLPVLYSINSYTQTTLGGYNSINHPPVPILEHDGKWKSYFEEPTINHLICYSYTCSVNFTGEKSYDPDGDNIRFLWIYDYSATKNSKDPGVYTFYRGNHLLILRVIDAHGLWSEIRYSIDVVGPKSKEESIYLSKEKEEFRGPEITLQTEKEGVYISSGVYICETVDSFCSLNFSVNNPDKKYTYEWYFPEKPSPYFSTNPRSYSFPIGDSSIRLIVKDLQGMVIWDKEIQIQVLQTQSQKIQKTKHKNKKLKIIDFFDPPELLLQSDNPKIQIDGDIYTCYTKTKYCSLNFKLDDVERGYMYEWYFSDKAEPYFTSNPRSFRFPIGMNQVIIVARDKAGNEIWRKSYLAKIIKTTGNKKTKNKSPIPESSVIKERFIINYETPNLSQSSNIPKQSEGMVLFLLSAGLIGGGLIRKKLYT